MLRTVFLFLAGALTVTSPGCTYFRHLGKDASETVHVGVGASLVPGIYLRAQAPVFGTSVGYLPHATYVGSDYGYTSSWRQAAAGVVAGGQMVRTHLDADIGKYWNGYLADAYLDQSHYLILNVVAVDKRSSLGKQTIPLTKFGGGVHVLFVGAQFGVDFVQALDLVTGVFGWDMLGDNDFHPEQTESADQLENAEVFESMEAAETLEDTEAADEQKPDVLEGTTDITTKHWHRAYSNLRQRSLTQINSTRHGRMS